MTPNTPTETGVRQLLHYMDAKCIPGLIWNEKYISNPRKYQGVHALFMYGCRGCGDIARYTGKGLCPECNTKASTYNNKLIWETVDRLSTEQPPRDGKRKGDGSEIDDANSKKHNSNGGK